LSAVKKFFRPYIKKTVVGSLAKMAEAVLELMLPTFMGRIIDIGIAQENIPYVARTALIMFGIIAVGLGCASICQYYASTACQGLGTDLRKALMKKIQEFSYKELDRFGSSTLINRITYDVNQVVQAFAMLIRLVSRGPFLCIGALIMAIQVAPKLAWIFFILIPLFVIVITVIMRSSVPLYKKAQLRLDRLGQILRENLGGVRVIRAFARHHEEKKRMDEATEELSNAYIRVSNLSALMNPLTLFIMNMGIIALLMLGGIHVNSGDMTQGDIVVLINYITQVLYALIQIANLVVLFTKAYASSGRIGEVLTCENSIENGSKTDICKNGDIITFDNVSFGYSGENTLTDISFSIPRGTAFGIVGTTGSGKSTVINLMMRFYDVLKGRVLFAGTDVREYNQTALRNCFGIAPQQAALFSGTVADNIRWGCPEASDEQVIAALKAAQAYDFVSKLDEGINSYIAEGGKNLSGGQKQRLTIARAIVRKPLVIILDDSLSALDYQTDSRLRESLKEYSSGSAVIIVSQRISSVRAADCILVLDDGECVGMGTHEELLKNCGTYKEIFETQSKAEGGAVA
jgi:ATP-binding cassette subfamily B protein